MAGQLLGTEVEEMKSLIFENISRWTFYLQQDREKDEKIKEEKKQNQ